MASADTSAVTGKVRRRTRGDLAWSLSPLCLRGELVDPCDAGCCEQGGCDGARHADRRVPKHAERGTPDGRPEREPEQGETGEHPGRRAWRGELSCYFAARRLLGAQGGSDVVHGRGEAGPTRGGDRPARREQLETVGPRLERAAA